MATLTSLDESITPDEDDVFHMVDVSDISSSPEGTSKKVKSSTLKGFFSDTHLEFTDPAVNAAVLTPTIDANAGVVITTTTTSNDQLLQDPTSLEAGLSFFVMNSNASTDVIVVNGQSLQIGEVAHYSFDGTEWSSDPERNTILGAQSTSYISGLDLTINVDPTKFDISAGKYIVVDSYTDQEKIVVSVINYPGVSAVSVTNIATQDFSGIGLNAAQEIIQNSVPYERAQIRDDVVIGTVIHLNRLTITSINRFTTAIDNNVASSLHDLSDIFGSVNKNSSFKVSANGANLFADRSAGTLYRMGVMPDNLKDPNHMDVAGITGGPTPGVNTTWISTWTTTDSPFFKLAFNNTAFTPGIFDDGTAVQADSLPQGSVANNRYSIHHFFYEPSSDIAVVQHGVNTYPSIADAEANESRELSDSLNPSLNNFLLLGWVILKGNATAVNDPATSKINNGPIFTGASGSGGSVSGTTTIQRAIDNSTQPHAVMVEAFQFQNGQALDSSSLLELLNIAGSITFSILGDGGILAAGMKSGASQGAAGASVNEMWRDTADNSIKLGV